MIDQIDEANALAQAERDAGVRRIVMAVAGEGLTDCQDCSDEIEEARRRAVPSTRRCVGCQAAAERRSRQYAGAGA